MRPEPFPSATGRGHSGQISFRSNFILVKFDPAGAPRRALQDRAVLRLGPAAFRAARLLAAAALGAHLFACAFYRVQRESAAGPEEAARFYAARGVDPAVRRRLGSRDSDHATRTRDSDSDPVTRIL